jgi:hypothetical protein
MVLSDGAVLMQNHFDELPPGALLLPLAGELRDRLTSAARRSGRSVVAEVLERLNASCPPLPSIDELLIEIAKPSGAGAGGIIPLKGWSRSGDVAELRR